MGGEYYCTSDARKPIWEGARKKALSPGEPFTIAPGQFGFLLSMEAVNVPADAMAFISIRAKTKFRGLINVSGFHVDPGYKGKLVFSVFNAGSSNIHLGEGDEVFLIWFADLDQASGKTRTEAGYTAIPNELINGMNREVVSLSSLATEIANLKVNMRVQGIIFGIAVAFFFTVLSGAVGYLFQNGFLKPILDRAVPVIAGQPATQLSSPPPVLPPASAPVPVPPPAAPPPSTNVPLPAR
jgi:dCTP deaminase